LLNGNGGADTRKYSRAGGRGSRGKRMRSGLYRREGVKKKGELFRRRRRVEEDDGSGGGKAKKERERQSRVGRARKERWIWESNGRRRVIG
jgi:hypothetical protein